MGCYHRNDCQSFWCVFSFLFFFYIHCFENLSPHSLPLSFSYFVAGIFAAVSAGQMGVWAIKKHRAYKREFGTKYPKGRKAMIPFIF